MSNGLKSLESMSQAEWYIQWTLGKFKSFLRGRILEVGCGIGNFTKTLTNFGQVWAMDIESNYIEQTKKLVGKNAQVGIGDIEKGKYFFSNTKFDAIVCINVLEHIKDDTKALENLYDLLDNKGYLILLVPAHKFLFGEIDKSVGHFRRYTVKEIKSKMVEVGFEILNCRKINFLGGVGWFFASKIFSDGTVSETKIKMFNFLGPLGLLFENLIEPPFGTSILLIVKRRL